jgi:hypothetical protein
MSWKGFERNRSFHNLWYCLGFCLEELTQTIIRTVELRVENSGYPEQEAERHPLEHGVRLGRVIKVRLVP